MSYTAINLAIQQLRVSQLQQPQEIATMAAWPSSPAPLPHHTTSLMPLHPPASLSFLTTQIPIGTAPKRWRYDDMTVTAPRAEATMATIPPAPELDPPWRYNMSPLDDNLTAIRSRQRQRDRWKAGFLLIQHTERLDSTSQTDKPSLPLPCRPCHSALIKQSSTSLQKKRLLLSNPKNSMKIPKSRHTISAKFPFTRKLFAPVLCSRPFTAAKLAIPAAPPTVAANSTTATTTPGQHPLVIAPQQEPTPRPRKKKKKKKKATKQRLSLAPHLNKTVQAHRATAATDPQIQRSPMEQVVAATVQSHQQQQPKRIHKWFQSLLSPTTLNKIHPQRLLWDQFLNHAHLSATHKSQTYFFPTEYYHSCPTINWTRIVLPTKRTMALISDVPSLLTKGNSQLKVADWALQKAHAAILASKTPTQFFEPEITTGWWINLVAKYRTTPYDKLCKMLELYMTNKNNPFTLMAIPKTLHDRVTSLKMIQATSSPPFQAAPAPKAQWLDELSAPLPVTQSPQPPQAPPVRSPLLTLVSTLLALPCKSASIKPVPMPISAVSTHI